MIYNAKSASKAGSAKVEEDRGSHEEGSGDDESDREHDDRQGWVPRIRDGTGNRFRSLQKIKKKTQKI